MEKRFWALMIKKSLLGLAVVFLAGVVCNYFAEWNSPITSGLIAIAIYIVAWICLMALALVTNALGFWLFSSNDIMNAVLDDLRQARLPAPREEDPKNHTYLAHLADDESAKVDDRIQAAVLHGGYRNIMAQGIFMSLRVQSAMDAAVLRYYQEAPKRI